MIERHQPTLSVRAQCRLLSISRSSFYDAPQGETEVNLALMRLIERQFLETPFYGVRQMTWHLQNEGHAVNQKRIRRLMRLNQMGASLADVLGDWQRLWVLAFVYAAFAITAARLSTAGRAR